MNNHFMFSGLLLESPGAVLQTGIPIMLLRSKDKQKKKNPVKEKLPLF